MSTTSFVLSYLISSLICKWIISWGGAQTIEGWKSWWIIGWFAGSWSAEQIRLYTLLIWIISSVLFMVGLVNPNYRF